ncbi:MAG: ABC transporter permease [Acidobacteriota bacterium]
MDKVLAIIKREYMTRVRSKGFIIGTILSPLIMSSFVLIPVLMARGSSRNELHLVVLDQTSDAALITRIDQLLNQENAKADRYTVTYEVVPTGESLEARMPSLNERIKKDEIAGYLVLPRDVLTRDEVAFHAKNVSDFSNRRRIENALNGAIVERRLTTAGINPDQVKSLTREVDLTIVNQQGQSERGQTFILAYALLMILYITILVYGMMVLRGVIEEKQSRIVEVLLSSVKPFQLMLGKLVGIGLVGLTQYTIWALSVFLISGFATAQMVSTGSFQIPHISPIIIVFFVVYFLLGYFLFATLYAMVGAMVSSDEDAQQMQMPITMLMVLPMIFSSMILRNPNGTLSLVLSLIPFFTPVIMFMRICLNQPPAWQIALSVVIMLATILGTVWLAGKIYRVGILMYGKRPTLPELARWMKYS